MFDVFIMIYVVCCVCFMLMCATSVVYMIHDMLANRRTVEDESEGSDEDVTDDA